MESFKGRIKNVVLAAEKCTARALSSRRYYKEWSASQASMETDDSEHYKNSKRYIN